MAKKKTNQELYKLLEETNKRLDEIEKHTKYCGHIDSWQCKHLGMNEPEYMAGLLDHVQLDEHIKHLERWKKEHDCANLAILSHYGLEKEIARIKDTMQEDQKNIIEALDEIRKNIADSYAKAIQYANKMNCIHEREEHTKPNPKNALKERIKRLKGTLQKTISCMEDNIHIPIVDKNNLEHILHECWAVLVSVEEKFEKDEGDEEFNFDPRDYK